MKKRIISLLLCALMLVPMLVACNGGGGNATGGGDTQPPAETTGNGGTDANGYILDSIPADTNFGNKEVVILYWEDREMQEFVAESADGSDPVNDALYKRNNTVQNRIGVKLNFMGTPGNSTRTNDYVHKVETAARSGSGEYDVLAAYSRTLAQAASVGYAYDLLTFDVLDFDAPWWSRKLLETSLIGGKLPYASGDISTNLLYLMNCTFFNTDLITALGLENPYDLVKANEWTLDKMFAMSEGLYQDLSENNKKDANDQFGIVLLDLNMDALFYGCGLTVVEYVDGFPTLGSQYTGEKCYDWICKMVDMFYTSKDAYYDTSTSVARNCFGSGHSLFLVDSPFCVDKSLNNYEDCNYGIVPCPKWDSAQEDYLSGLRYGFTLYAIFAGSKNASMAATTLECLASEGYRTVTPALFETTMKFQYALDSDASRMFDLIRNGIVFDFGRIFSDSLTVHAAHTYRNKIKAGSTDWMSYMGRLRTPLENSLQIIVESFKKNMK